MAMVTDFLTVGSDILHGVLIVFSHISVRVEAGQLQLQWEPYFPTHP